MIIIFLSAKTFKGIKMKAGASYEVSAFFIFDVNT